jgi:hypothetical protein
LPGIPFTADVDIENRTISPKGTLVVHRLVGKIARNSQGSLRTVVDLNVTGKPHDPTQVTVHVHDAPRKADSTLFPASKLAYLRFEGAEPRVARHPQPRLKQIPFGRLAGPSAELPHSENVDLGVDSSNSQPLRHGRETTSIPATFARNKKPYTTVMDYWFSQDLQAVVLVRRLGPNRSVQTVTLRNIRRANPLRSLFQIPKDYKIEIQYPDDSLSQGYCPLP